MSQRLRTSLNRWLPWHLFCRRCVVAVALLTASFVAGCEPDSQDQQTAPAADTPFGDTDEQTPAVDDAPSDHPGDVDGASAPGAPPDFANNVADVRPAVVNIYTRTDPPDHLGAAPLAPPDMVPEERLEQSLGSGFVFDDDGLVLTNHHVVAGAAEIAVRLLDERVYTAEVIGADPPTDVAVLQLDIDDDDSLPVAPLGDSDDLEVGNWIIAIGNPLGLASTVTAGIVSATGRQVMPPGGQLRFQDFIQTDASINPGSSGGPLVDTSSHVMGIATAVTADAQGLGFAIPINMIHEILDDLIEYGRVERSWLGVYIGEVPSRYREELDLPDQGGAMITRLVDGGPADDAGLEPGDVVVEIDGRSVDDASHLAWLAATIGVDERVDVHIWRGDREMTISLVMGALPRPGE